MRATPRMNSFTTTLITRNEERNLPRALGSIRELADEVLVVDSGSRDRTVAIAREHGARVLERDWTDFSDQKNFAAAQAAHDWVFSLDADEELSPELAAELRTWKEQPATAVAYRMPRRARYLGRWIRHSGWYPDPKVRLYRRDRARFVGLLHEALEVDGPVGRFQGDLYHHTFATLAEHEAQIERYATLAARQLVASGHRHWLLPLLVSPPWMFLRTFFWKLGFLDGAAGWHIARLTARSSFLKYDTLRRWGRGQGPGDDAVARPR
ncbi:MAG: glycosyltransferase family 2 protein [Candidatus Acidoferrales bacterium]